MKYTGIIEKVYYSSNQWSSIRIKTTDKKAIYSHLNAAGNISYPSEGYEIEADGDIDVDPKYGTQLKVKKCIIRKPNNEDSIKIFLASGFIRGIGPTTADKIYDMFGKRSIEILRDSPEELLKVKGIGKKTLPIIIESYNEGVAYEKLYLDLGGKITKRQAQKIREKIKTKELTIEKIKENPYILIYKIDGIGFLKADEIAKSMGVPEDSHYRVGAALVYSLIKLSEEGHCFSSLEYMERVGIDLLCPFPKTSIKSSKMFIDDILPHIDSWGDIKEEMIRKYGISKWDVDRIDNWVKTAIKYIDLMSECLMDEIKEGRIVYDNNDADIEGERIYLKRLYDDEKTCAEIIAYMLRQKTVKRFSAAKIVEKLNNDEETRLGDEQIEAVKTSLTHRISIITGGPGRGKTTTIKKILEIWNNDKTVILCAPTGRAAQRMKESTGREASTIHSKMMHPEKRPENHLIIIDESSMLDISLAAVVLRYAKDNQLVFIGDVDQLPSVGPGNFFRDIISSGKIPTTVLRKGYRNEGSIEKNSRAINNGESFKNLVFDRQFSFINCKKDHIQEQVVNEYLRLSKIYPLKEICVLCPMRQRSNSAANIINKLIREKINPYNPKAPQIKNLDFRIGDRVMCLSNNKDKKVIKGEEEISGVYNGDCGEIIQISVEEGLLKIEFDDGRIGSFSTIEMEDFTLAFAMTIHKSQGSEYDAVILPMNTEHFIMLQRNLLYTGVTRAKKYECLIGEAKAVNIAIRNTDYKLRNSLLLQRVNYWVKIAA